MITDKETNFVYISDRLEAQCPSVYAQLKHWFEKLGIKYATLPGTKDLWIVDFMPLQIDEFNFLQFTYDPDYLKPKKYQDVRTDPKGILNGIGVVPKRIDFVLDGGNIVKGKDKAIATTKIFKENPDYAEFDLICEIKCSLDIEQLIIIPQEPGDYIGHADGMVRFVDENMVIVNQYPKNKIYEDFAYNLWSALRNAGLHCIDFPYTSWQNDNADDATGCYINFLEIGHYIFYPIFNNDNDQLALEQLKKAFMNREFIPINCCDLAKFGGVLNCATWNIFKDQVE